MKDFSSAEMTEYWRSLYPKLSGDTLSIELATLTGIAKAKEFEDQYGVAAKFKDPNQFFPVHLITAQLKS